MAGRGAARYLRTMFLPLADNNPYRRIVQPYVTFTLIGLNVAIFLLTTGLVPAQSAQANALGLGLIPAIFTDGAMLAPNLQVVPSWATWLTYMFMHGGWMHLIGNMLFLWVFGDNVEDAMGHLRFLVFFLLCGMAGALLHALMNPESEQPLIGASGAISGVIASYLMLYPRVRIWGLAFKAIPLHIPAMYALGAWVLFQLLSAVFDQQGAVGWWAHLGGLGAGAALTPLLIRRELRLFGRVIPGKP